MAALEEALMEKLIALNTHLETMLLASAASSSSATAGYMGGLTMGGGGALGLADCSLAPKLFALSVAGQHYHPRFMQKAFSATVDLPDAGDGAAAAAAADGAAADGPAEDGIAVPPPPLKLGALKAYMNAVFAHPAFQETAYAEKTVVWGWGNARKG